MLIKENDIILFQGDSITDCNRNREDGSDLGRGYPLITASWFSALYPEMNVQFINRGISGDRVPDLLERWQRDCIDLRPTWVSIYIGINDTWRRYDRHDPTTTEQFEASYRDLLERTTKQLNGVNLMMIEPFVLPHPADRMTWREDLDPKIQVVRQLAMEYGALLVPLDGLFAQASMKAEPAYWAPDGVHPSPAGHGLIAQAWLKAVRVI